MISWFRSRGWPFRKRTPRTLLDSMSQMSDEELRAYGLEIRSRSVIDLPKETDA